MSELLPCPFCGGEAAINTDGDYPTVNCMGHDGPDYPNGFDGCNTFKYSVEAWNTRADHIVDANEKVNCPEKPDSSYQQAIPNGSIVTLALDPWKPVEEVEIEEYKEYYVWDGAHQDVANMIDGVWWQQFMEYRIDNVTHVMPLFNPPGGNSAKQET